MEQKYARTSSLARKFFEDFPDASLMPLMLSSKQQEAYERLVRPLLDLQSTSPDMPALCTAANTLISNFKEDTSQYELARSAAEYVQSPFALCLADAAAARAVLNDSAAFNAALAATDPVAFTELLAEDIQRRFLANSITNPALPNISVVLDKHPAVAAGKPAFNGLDSLLLPANSTYAFLHKQQQGGAADKDAAVVAAAFRPMGLALSDTTTVNGSSSSTDASNPAPPGTAAAAAAASHQSGPSILKRAVWRRQITRSCSHYLGPILGKDGTGTVVLTGTPLACMVKGVKVPPTAEAMGAVDTTHSSSSSSSSVSNLSFVGYRTAAEAQAALDGCIAEITHRYFKRHLSPVTDSQGQAVHPLAVATAHHLLLLLPEPVETVLPTAVYLDAAALQGAADRGAWEGPAAAAAAAAPAAAAAGGAGLAEMPRGAIPPGTAAAARAAAAAAGEDAAPPAAAAAAAGSFKDVVLSFDLALHPSMDGFLLSAAAVSPLAAFAYDGDDMYTLPSAVRALASGGVLLDPAASAHGVSALSNPAPAGEDSYALHEQASAAVATASESISPTGLMSNPAHLRALLYATRSPPPPQQQQQQQQQGVDATNWPQLQLQLKQAHGWVWGVLKSTPAAGGPGEGRGLPAAVAAAVKQRWWSGPIMKGSALEGSVTDQ